MCYNVNTVLDIMHNNIDSVLDIMCCNVNTVLDIMCYNVDTVLNIICYNVDSVCATSKCLITGWLLHLHRGTTQYLGHAVSLLRRQQLCKSVGMT